MTDRSLIARLPAAWLQFADFVRKPAVAQPTGLRAGWRTAAVMFGLNLAGLAVLLLVLPTWQFLTGIEGPSAFEGIEFKYLLPAVVLVAPLVEECLFRGWLSGRPRALWLLGCTIGAAVLFALLAEKPASAGLAPLGALVAAIAGWVILHKRAAPAWFARHFGKIFYLAAVLFALVHVFNYSSPGLAHLPMVLPQFWAGLTLGFVRTQVGLPAAMLVHGASNAIALSLVGLGG